MLAILGLGLSLPAIGEIGQEAVGLIDGGSGNPECQQWRAILGGNWSSVDMTCSGSEAQSRVQVLQAGMSASPDVASRVRSWYSSWTPDGGNCTTPSSDVHHARLVAAAACGFWGGAGSGINEGEAEAQSIVEMAASAAGQQAPSGGGGGGAGTTTDGGDSVGDRLVDTLTRILTGSSDLSAVERRAQNTLAGADAGSRVPTSTETGFGTQDVVLFVVAAAALVFIVTQLL